MRFKAALGLLLSLLGIFLPTVLLHAESSDFPWSLEMDIPGWSCTSEESNGQLDGTLPAGVSQNYFGWQDSRVKSWFMEENGRKFCRMSASNALSVGPQFAVTVPKLEEGDFYRITFTARNLSDGLLHFYLREGPSPYKNIGRGSSIPATGEWETRSAIVQFHAPASNSYHLYFNFTADGEYDLGRISITKATEAEFLAFRDGAELKKIIRPSAEWKNFIFSSTFPLGIPAGWTLRYGKASISSDVSGPSGQPALKLEKDFGETQTPRLISAPFQVPEPEKLYSVSFSYRGPGNISCNWQKFPASENWTRASMTLKLTEVQNGALLDFQADDTVWLDAVCVAELGQTEFQHAGACEIALGLPDSDASEARIQFDDEPAVLLYRLMGEAAGSKGSLAELTLRGAVTNIWGETRKLPEIHPESLDGTLEYLIFPETPLGQFRVELQVFRGGKAVSPTAEFLISRFRRPRYWGQDAPDSPFGIHQEPISRLLVSLKAGGLNWIRLHDGGFRYCSWPSVEEEKGKWTFHDAEIQTYRVHHMMLYGQLVGAPTWASFYADSEYKPDHYRKHFAAPRKEYLADFENYAYTMVKRYEKEIRNWFIWNEPWGGGFFHCGYDTEKGKFLEFEDLGGAYAEVMKAAYRGAKRAEPDIWITGIGTYGNSAWFTQQVVDGGGYDFCDEVDYHEYIPKTFGYPGDGNLENLQSAFAPVMEKYGPIQKPIVMSEGSPLSNGGDPGSALQGIYRHVLPWENTERSHLIADDVTRYTLSLLGVGVKRIFLYTAHGHRNLMKTSFQLLLSGDGYPHTSLAAFSAFAWLAEDSQFVRYVELAPDLYAAVFQKKDGTSFAAITGKRRVRATIHSSAAGAQGSDLYGNPLSFPFQYRGFLQYVTSEESAEELAKKISAEP